MKIILCGYNWSGCEALKILKKNKYKVFVFTHSSNYYESDLVEYCKKNKILFNLKKISTENLPFKPDMIISISYKYKISQEVLSCSRFKAFNLHPSLLPKYRGCSSVTWSMINGEKFTGFSYHYMDNKFDSGNIILKKKMEINDFDLQITLYYRVMFESLKYLEKVIKLVQLGFKGKKQIGKSSYYNRGAPNNGIIEKKWPINKKIRFFKAMINPPRPLATYCGKKIKTKKDLE
jgi:methionyl-tRNA formyltransferase